MQYFTEKRKKVVTIKCMTHSVSTAFIFSVHDRKSSHNGGGPLLAKQINSSILAYDTSINIKVRVDMTFILN